MSAPVQAVQNSTEFPEAVDVVVIGAGIVGVSTAYELARRGISVALLEKGFVGAEQSSRNWGWCRQQNRDPRELPLVIHSLERLDKLAEETGEDLGFRRSGLVYATTRQSEIDGWEAWEKKAREFGVRSDILTAAQAKAMLPESKTKWLGGVSSPTDGYAEPSLAAPAIATAARKLGAYVHQQCAVRGLDITNGQVAGVWTERGKIRTTRVVIAAGAWTSLFCRRHGIDLPLAMVNGTAMRTTVGPQAFNQPIYTPTFCARPRQDGAYTLSIAGRGRIEITPQLISYATKFWKPFKGRLPNLRVRVGESAWRGPEAWHSWQADSVSPFEMVRVVDPRPDLAMVDEAINALRTEFPALAGLQVAQAWGGLIDSTPDIIPVISPIDHCPGLVVAAGFSGHGFGIGPGAGVLAADLATSAKPVVDPTPYRYSRLVDGTKLGKPGEM